METLPVFVLLRRDRSAVLFLWWILGGNLDENKDLLAFQGYFLVKLEILGEKANPFWGGAHFLNE